MYKIFFIYGNFFCGCADGWMCGLVDVRMDFTNYFGQARQAPSPYFRLIDLILDDSSIPFKIDSRISS